MRNSSMVSHPQNLITIQIRNNFQKKKLFHHRASVLNEIVATQSIMYESLNKHIPSKQNSFAKERKKQKEEEKHNLSQFGKYLSERKNQILSQPVEKRKEQRTFKICGQLREKLKQLTNISNHFERACERKVMQKNSTCQTDISDLQENIDQEIGSRLLKRNLEQTKIKKKWRMRLKDGQDAINNSRQWTEMRFRNQKKEEVNDQNTKQGITNCGSLRQIYYGHRQSRKTAPVAKGGHFYKLFCQSRQSKQVSKYEGKLQNESAINLQQFVTGGQKNSFNQFDDYLNIKSFASQRERFMTLNRIYNYVKENYALKFKDMTPENIKQPNMMSLVYYIQNAANLTEMEKKYIRKKMNFVE